MEAIINIVVAVAGIYVMYNIIDTFIYSMKGNKIKNDGKRGLR